METNFEFKNFVPEKTENKLCVCLYSSLLEAAPYDSAITAVVEVTRSGEFRTNIEICAQCGHFLSETKDTDLLISVERAEESILKNLLRWKKNRFK
jgi:hypothetical protein